MSNFYIIVTVTVYCHEESGAKCKIYGSLRVNIGHRAQNQEIEIRKESSPNFVNIPKAIEYDLIIDRQVAFGEYDDFRMSEKSISFTGEIIKKTNAQNTDTTITINSSFEAKNIDQSFGTDRCSNNGNDYVDIRVQLL